MKKYDALHLSGGMLSNRSALNSDAADHLTAFHSYKLCCEHGNE
jgi:hypothetical protein